MSRPYPFLSQADFLAQKAELDRTEFRANAEKAVVDSMARALRSSLTEQQQLAAKSLVGRACGDAQKTAKQRVKSALKPGGAIRTDRDELYCRCGCLLTAHTPGGHPEWCPCKAARSA